MAWYLARPAAAAGVLLLLGASACSYVGRDDFDAAMAGVHADMEAQDGRISANTADIAALRSDVDALQQDLAALREEFGMMVTQLENAVRFAAPIHFEFDKADIRPGDSEMLDRFAAVVARYYPNAVVTVEGFADPAGSRAYNKRLSERRAAAVGGYLTSTGGLDPASVRTVGYGEDRLVVPGAAGPGDAGRENRRVAFVVEYTG